MVIITIKFVETEFPMLRAFSRSPNCLVMNEKNLKALTIIHMGIKAM